MRILTRFTGVVAAVAVASLSACGGSGSTSAATGAGSSASTLPSNVPTTLPTTSSSRSAATSSAAATSAAVAASTTSAASPAAFPPATGACKLVTPQEIQQTVGVRLISVEHKTYGDEDECVYGVTKASGLTLGVSVVRKTGGVAIVNDTYGKFVDFPGHKAVWYGAMLYVAVGADALEVDLTGAAGHQSEQIAAAVARLALPRM